MFTTTTEINVKDILTVPERQQPHSTSPPIPTEKARRLPLGLFPAWMHYFSCWDNGHPNAKRTRSAGKSHLVIYIHYIMLSRIGPRPHRLPNNLRNRPPHNQHNRRPRRRHRNPPPSHKSHRRGGAAHLALPHGTGHNRDNDGSAAYSSAHNPCCGVCGRLLYCRMGVY